MASIKIGDYVTCTLDRSCRGYVTNFSKVGNKTILIGINDHTTEHEGQKFSGSKQYFSKRKPPKDPPKPNNTITPKQITIFDALKEDDSDA